MGLHFQPFASKYQTDQHQIDPYRSIIFDAKNEMMGHFKIFIVGEPNCRHTIEQTKWKLTEKYVDEYQTCFKKTCS